MTIENKSDDKNEAAAVDRLLDQYNRSYDGIFRYFGHEKCRVPLEDHRDELWAIAGNRLYFAATTAAVHYGLWTDGCLDITAEQDVLMETRFSGQKTPSYYTVQLSSFPGPDATLRRRPDAVMVFVYSDDLREAAFVLDPAKELRLR